LWREEGWQKDGLAYESAWALVVGYGVQLKLTSLRLRMATDPDIRIDMRIEGGHIASHLRQSGSVHPRGTSNAGQA